MQPLPYTYGFAGLRPIRCSRCGADETWNRARAADWRQTSTGQPVCQRCSNPKKGPTPCKR